MQTANKIKVPLKVIVNQKSFEIDFCIEEEYSTDIDEILAEIWDWTYTDLFAPHLYLEYDPLDNLINVFVDRELADIINVDEWCDPCEFDSEYQAVEYFFYNSEFMSSYIDIEIA